MGPIGISRRIL